MGGMGLTHVAKAFVFEEAGYSWLGPTALNIHAPDEGNIHLMEEVGSERQKERWLRPQVQGRTILLRDDRARGRRRRPVDAGHHGHSRW